MHTRHQAGGGKGSNPELLTTESQLLTKIEVAKLLRKSTRTVEHWVNSGYISCIRISHSVLFDRKQLFEDLKRFQTGRIKDLLTR
jgi:hypothetical protein